MAISFGRTRYRRPEEAGMLSARTIYEEIFDNDEAFGLFCSIAASGEAQGGWENGKIAALVPGSQAGLVAKIARHGADEDKHGRIFTALLRKRGLEPVPVPADTDYTMRLEARSRLSMVDPFCGAPVANHHDPVTPPNLPGGKPGSARHSDRREILRERRTAREPRRDPAA